MRDGKMEEFVLWSYILAQGEVIKQEQSLKLKFEFDFAEPKTDVEKAAPDYFAITRDIVGRY